MMLAAEMNNARSIFNDVGVEVWEFDLDRPLGVVDAYWWLLDEGERRDAARLSSARLRERFIVRRGVRRHILGERVALAPERLEFEKGPFGKPCLARGGLEFSASSSEGKALLAVSTVGAVGVDLERIYPDFDFAGLLTVHFTTDERAALTDSTAAEFYRAWVQKEAAGKALGAGLRAVDIEPGVTPARNLEMGSRWAAAVAFGANDLGSCEPNGQNSLVRS